MFEQPAIPPAFLAIDNPANTYAFVLQDQAPAPTPPKVSFPLWGLNTFNFIPNSAATRTRFGSNWSGFGPGIGPTLAPSGARAKRLLPDFSVLQSRRGRNETAPNALLIMAGVGKRSTFGNKSSVNPSVSDTGEVTLKVAPNVPYYGWAVDGVFSVIDLGGRDNREISFGLCGALILGYTINQNAFVETRYRQMTQAAGFDFSGIEFRIGVRF
jgi:hypothetical protein